MINTIEAVIENGKILPLEEINAPDGTKILITILIEDEKGFWASASEDSIDEVWENEEDDIYAELLEK